MVCCVECFKDIEIREIIESNNTKGDCSFCGSNDTFIMTKESKPIVRSMFTEILDLYTKTEDKKIESDLLQHHLHREWNIFSNNLSANEIEEIMTFILEDLMEDYEWDYKVHIRDLGNNKKIKKINTLGDLTWDDFSDKIRIENRYFIDGVDLSKLEKYIESLVAQYDCKNIFYRSRIQREGNIIEINNMGAPPHSKSISGRINPEGISNLYLSDSIETSISEVRPELLDIVKVAEFIPKQSISIVDLTLIDSISPFSFGSNSETYLHYYVNMNHLKSFEMDLLKPVKRCDVPVEYIPTQYICEYIKKLGYDGVKYKSVINHRYNNIAAFDESKFDKLNLKTVEIKDVIYDLNVLESL